VYEHGSSLKPVCGVSNGTIRGYGGTLPNKDFVTFGNELCSFLLIEIFAHYWERTSEENFLQFGASWDIPPKTSK
jgi:hypothetical protein